MTRTKSVEPDLEELAGKYLQELLRETIFIKEDLHPHQKGWVNLEMPKE